MTTDLTTLAAHDAAQSQRDAAVAKLEAVRATVEAKAMERTLTLLESPQPVAVPWSDYPGFDDFNRWPTAYQRPYVWTSPDDRTEGRYRPIYENANDVRRIRAQSRTLVELFPVSRSLLRKLSDYIIGTGWEFVVKPKKAYKLDPTAIELAGVVQRVLDQHLDYNNFVGNLDREIHEQSRIDGDSFPTLYPEGDKVRIELTDPGCIVEPAAPHAPDDYGRSLNRMLKTAHKLNGWWHGVHTVFNHQMKRDDVGRPLGYHAVFDNTGAQWDYLPSVRVEHIKQNLCSLARVGAPDFYFVQQALEIAEKIRRNTGEGVAILAAIVMIRQNAEGVTRSSIESMVADNSTSSYEKLTQNSSRTTYNEQVRPGTIKDAPYGMTQTCGPLGTLRSPVYVEVEQHILRIAGNFWSLPEYMSTGSANDINFASSLVAESPFVKYAEQEQTRYGGHYVNLHWKAIKLHCECGQLKGHNFQQLCQYLDINGEYSSPASRDKLQQAQVNKILSEAGILSDRSFAGDMGLDLDEEIANGAKKPEPPPMAPGMSPFGGSPFGRQPGRGEPEMEEPEFGSTEEDNIESISPRLEALAAHAMAAFTEATRAIEGKWITVNGGDGGGVHIQIDDDGEVVKGPADLKGKDLDDPKGKSKSEPKGRTKKAATGARKAKSDAPVKEPKSTAAGAKIGTSPTSLEDVEVDGKTVKVYRNPTLSQAKAWMTKHDEDLRGIIEPGTGDLLIWPAYKATHDQMAGANHFKLGGGDARLYVAPPGRGAALDDKKWKKLKGISKEVQESRQIDGLRVIFENRNADP